jgi:hypothetical protein
MSAVAALAVASPAAVIAVSDLSDSTNPPTQHRQFVQAATITDLPNELMSALSQGLSQFGINLPPMPGSLLTGSGSSTPATLTTPGLGTSPLTPPGGLGLPPSPTATVPDLAAANPTLTNPALTPALTSPVGVPPGGALPPAPGANTAGVLPPAPGANTAGVLPPAPGANTAGVLPPAPGANTTTGLTTTPAGTDPALAAPISNGAALPAPGEVPITSSPIGLGLDPAAGSFPAAGYPALDPSLSGVPATTSGGGGLLSDIMSAADQLGAGQAIDLLKGVLMPAIMSAMKPAGAPAADAAAAAASAVPAAAAPAAAALPGV